MPELPDLEYIVSTLGPVLSGRRIEQVRVRNPIVLRLGRRQLVDWSLLKPPKE